MKFNKWVIVWVIIGFAAVALVRCVEEVDMSNTSWKSYTVVRGDTLVEIIDAENPRRKWYQQGNLDSVMSEIVEYNDKKGIDAVYLKEGDSLYLPQWNFGTLP